MCVYFTFVRSSIRRTKRLRPQLEYRIFLTFRYPDIDEILDGSGIIEPVGRCHLAAAAQREQHRPSHISFADAELHRLCSIDVELESLQVVRLLNPHINGSANLTDFLSYGIRDLLVDRLISSDHLNIQRRWKSKVKRLADDVGRQEVKSCPGKVAIQAETQVANVIRCRLVIGFQ